jgi:RNA polymerase sigma-54 factor
MKLEMSTNMRMEQRMMLAPRMIQSMEILQLPILALQERIEQELNNNPVLEIEEPASDENAPKQEQESQEEIGEKDLVVDTDNDKINDFERLESIDQEYQDYMGQAGSFRRAARSDNEDAKLQAMKNTAAPDQSIHEYLIDQWGLVDAEQSIKKAGERIIDYIDDRGYLSVRLEQLHNKDRADFNLEHLKKALKLVQKLEPPGVGARDLSECLLIQIAQSIEDMSFETRLISEHLDNLLENRLPDIAKKMKCSIEQINNAVVRMSKLDTSPGLQIGQNRNHPVTADVIVESDDTGNLTARLANSNLPPLRISSYYSSIAKDNRVSEKTRKFLQDNIRSAKWIMDAIEQRRSTLLRVTRSIVKHQKEFFEKGQLHLKPLPMATVADDVGVHLATISRAVAGKYVQCERGILPLRKFFSGGTHDDSGKAHSWEAVRAKLQLIIDSEDKSKPYSDDQIRKKLAETGINHIARRTVAKYRNILNIPSARLRKKY